jgi:hypothetical protein
MQQFKELVVKNGWTKNVVLAARSEHYRFLQGHLPEPLFEESSGPDGFVFAQF